MANEQNLCPVPITSVEQAKRMGHIGGSKSTPKKKFAAQLRELKKKGLSDENCQKIASIMEDPDASILDIFMYIQSIKNHCKNATQMTLVAKTLIDLHKAHHGEKIKTENVHHVFNWSSIAEIYEEYQQRRGNPEESNI